MTALVSNRPIRPQNLRLFTMLPFDVRVDTLGWEIPLVQAVAGDLIGAFSGGLDLSTLERPRSTWIHLRGAALPGAFQAKCRVDSGGRAVLVVEGSLPKVLAGDNVVAATIDECLAAMQMVESELPVEGLRPGDPRRRMLRRVDLVRDFYPAPSGGRIIRALSNDTYRRTGATRYTVDRGSAGSTIERGAQNSRSVLYDKEPEVWSHSRGMPTDVPPRQGRQGA